MARSISEDTKQSCIGNSALICQILDGDVTVRMFTFISTSGFSDVLILFMFTRPLLFSNASNIDSGYFKSDLNVFVLGESNDDISF